MILLHGGFSNDMLAGMVAIFVASVILIIWFHALIKKTDLYKEHFLKMNALLKLISYTGFLFMSVFIAYGTAFIFVILLAVILSQYSKHLLKMSDLTSLTLFKRLCGHSVFAVSAYNVKPNSYYPVNKSYSQTSP